VLLHSRSSSLLYMKHTAPKHPTNYLLAAAQACSSMLAHWH